MQLQLNIPFTSKLLDAVLWMRLKLCWFVGILSMSTWDWRLCNERVNEVVSTWHLSLHTKGYTLLKSPFSVHGGLMHIGRENSRIYQH